MAFSSPTNTFLTALKWLDTFEILFNLHIAGCSNRFFFFYRKTHVFNPFPENDWVEGYGVLDVAGVERYERRDFHLAHSDERPGSAGERTVEVSRQLFGTDIGGSGSYPTICRSCQKGKEHRCGWYWKICLSPDQFLSTCKALYKTLDRIRVISRKTISKR